MDIQGKAFLKFFPLEFSNKQIRDLSLVLSLLIVILAFSFKNYTLLWALLPTLFGGFVYKPTLFIPAFFWFGLSNLLGFLSSKVLLTTIFILFVIPVGFLRKWTQKDNLMIDKDTPSTFKNRNITFTPNDLERPF